MRKKHKHDGRTESNSLMRDILLLIANNNNTVAINKLQNEITELKTRITRLMGGRIIEKAQRSAEANELGELEKELFRLKSES